MGINEYIDFVKWLVPFVVAYNVWLHNKLIANEKEIAINTVKDDEMWDRMDKMIGKLEHIETQLTEIKLDLAHEKGKNS